MDLLTHGLVGAVIGQGFFADTLGEKAIWIGAIASLAPDLDVFIYSFSNPLYELVYHRHFSHSLFFGPIGSFIITLLFYWYSPEYRTHVGLIYLEVLVLFLSQGLLDAFTIYGTQLWWPFSNARVSWDLIHLFNPWLSIISFFGLIFSFWLKDTFYAQLSVWLFIPLFIFLYVRHKKALQLLSKLSQSRHHQMHRARAFPLTKFFLNYRSMYVYEGNVYLDEIRLPLFRQPTIKEGAMFPLFTENQLPAYVKEKSVFLHSYQVFDWFTDGYMTAVSNHPLVLIDLRYVKKIKPLKYLWCMEFPISPQAKVIKWRADYRHM
jgi:inner membrane protein